MSGVTNDGNNKSTGQQSGLFEQRIKKIHDWMTTMANDMASQVDTFLATEVKGGVVSDDTINIDKMFSTRKSKRLIRKTINEAVVITESFETFGDKFINRLDEEVPDYDYDTEFSLFKSVMTKIGIPNRLLILKHLVSQLEAKERDSDADDEEGDVEVEQEEEDDPMFSAPSEDGELIDKSDHVETESARNEAPQGASSSTPIHPVELQPVRDFLDTIRQGNSSPRAPAYRGPMGPLSTVFQLKPKVSELSRTEFKMLTTRVGGIETELKGLSILVKQLLRSQISQPIPPTFHSSSGRDHHPNSVHDHSSENLAYGHSAPTHIHSPATRKPEPFNRVAREVIAEYIPDTVFENMSAANFHEFKRSDFSIRKFKGFPDDYGRFLYDFMSVIGSNPFLSDMMKFHKLRELCEGTTLAAIECYPRDSEGYGLAWLALRKLNRFDGSMEPTLGNRLLKMKSTGTSTDNYLNLTYRLKSLTIEMARCKINPDQLSFRQCIPLKFEQPIRDQLKLEQRLNGKTLTIQETLDKIEFYLLLDRQENGVVEEDCCPKGNSKNNSNNSPAKGNQNSKSSNNDKPNNSDSKSNTSKNVAGNKAKGSGEKKKYPCTFCGSTDHLNFNCTVVPVNGRRKYLIDNNRCINCFSTDHKVEDCTGQKCGTCDEKHHGATCQKHQDKYKAQMAEKKAKVTASGETAKPFPK